MNIDKVEKKMIIIGSKKETKFGLWYMYKKREKMKYLSYPFKGNLISNIKTQNPDLLITFNLSGFELCTLTDNISYNLLNCKQIHILLDRNLKNEKYLSKSLSIAMFFYCLGEEYRDYLIHSYPNLPYLRNIQEWQAGDDEVLLEKNTKILENIIQDVIEQTRI